jgi:hypothetical protein
MKKCGEREGERIENVAVWTAHSNNKAVGRDPMV